MTHDYGRRAKRKLKGPALVSSVIGIALVAGLAAWFAWAWLARDGEHEAADLAAYSASGPPCPSVTPAQLETEGPQLRHSFQFGDASVSYSLSYAFGGADCAWIKSKGGKVTMCRFDSPGSVGVKTASGPQRLFTPGIGKHAAILIQDDKVSCVVTAKEMGS